MTWQFILFQFFLSSPILFLLYTTHPKQLYKRRNPSSEIQKKNKNLGLQLELKLLSSFVFLVPTTLPNIENKRKKKKKKERKGKERKGLFCSVKTGENRGKGNFTARMSELKDQGIKLFGKVISLAENEAVFNSVHVDDHHLHHQRFSNTAASEDNKNIKGEELTETKQDDDLSNPAAEESSERTSVSGMSDDNKTCDAEDETLSSPKSTKNEELGDNNSSQEKTLKKPDKILPCPRCNSMDTKFCYYNNYNVNQPRHFCKNCQRYWTAGGTMRNVPVGSGRRKNKNTCPSNYRHILVSDALQSARADNANGIHLPTLKPNGTILTFGSERPLCESMATVLNLAERTHNYLPNGFPVSEQRFAVPCGEREIEKDGSSAFSSTTSNSTEKGGSAESVSNNYQGYLPPVPPFCGTSWPYPLNSDQWRSPLPPAAHSPSGFPISFYPAPFYWGCAAPTPWNMPWLSPAPPCPGHSAPSTSPTSPTLGKHTRDGNVLRPPNLHKEAPLDRKNMERSIVVPKTLRINHPKEAAKSSIRSTLGVKNEKIDPNDGTSLFKAFPSKRDLNNHVADASAVLRANPAAFFRSQSFHESI